MTVTTPFPIAAASPRNAVPARRSFWPRIAADLVEAIARGTYVPGQRLPSEHALAKQFGVNRHTIRRSLASLCSQGLLRVTQGSGTYVEEFAVDVVLTKRTRHQQSMAMAGLRGGLQVLAAAQVRANGAQAQALKVPVRSALLQLHVLAQAESLPLHVSERFFPLPRFSGLDDVVRATGSITAAFSAHGVSDYTRLESRISTQMPDATLAGRLRQPMNRPVLVVESVNTDMDGVPIEFATAWFAGDRITLTVSHDA